MAGLEAGTSHIGDHEVITRTLGVDKPIATPAAQYVDAFTANNRGNGGVLHIVNTIAAALKGHQG